ncbi:hypothetical protein ACE5D9_04725 [Rickettsia sp. 2024-CO-Wats]|uniref:hypothetical protein n=1 Tax=unclassified Rickettsia TaxID=114295 RepID=UPI00370DB9C4
MLTLQGNFGNETPGTKANPLAVINVSGNVGVVGTNAMLGTNGLDMSNTAVLTIAAGGVFLPMHHLPRLRLPKLILVRLMLDQPFMPLRH